MAATRTSKKRSEIEHRGRIARAVRQEDLRQKVSGAKAIAEIDRCVNELIALDKEVKSAKVEKVIDNKTGNVELKLPGVTITRAECRVKILSRIIDTKFKLLNKVLPDLKQIELTDPAGNTFVTFAQAVSALNQSEEL